jgi:ketosteroid isomerase-like protein
MIYKTKTNLLVVICLSMTTLINAQTQKTMGNEKMTDEQKKVLSVIINMTNSFHNHDIDGVMASYEPNAVIVFEPESPVSDRNVLREMFLGAFTINPKYTFNGHEVFISGDIATHFTPWTMTGTAPDGTEIKQSGLSVAVLRKQNNGKWLMIFDNPHGQFLMTK